MQVATPRRIVLLSMDFSGKDGVSAVTRQALDALDRHAQRAGCALETWSLFEAPPARASLVRRTAGGSQGRFAGFGIRSGLHSARGTLLVAMHLHLAPVALPAVWRGGRLAVFLHGIEAWRALSWPRRRAVRGADLLLANSEHTATRFRAANPTLAAKPVAVCALGVPPAMCCSAEPAERGGYALIVGRMAAEERYKGHDALLDVWPRLLEAAPGAELVVAGDGDDRIRLEAKARALGLGARVRFLGRVSDERLAALYRDCALFAMPSAGEGFGLVFLEAMREAKPVIAGDGAAREVVEDGVSGIVVDPADHEQLLAALRRLFTEPETRGRMGQAGRARLAASFTPERFGERFLRALGLDGEVTPCAV